MVKTTPLDLTKYGAVVKAITAARNAHMATVVKVVDQIARGGSTEYMICGDPHSTRYHPTLQNCTMNVRDPTSCGPIPSAPYVPSAIFGVLWGLLGRFHSRILIKFNCTPD